MKDLSAKEKSPVWFFAARSLNVTVREYDEGLGDNAVSWPAQNRQPAYGLMANSRSVNIIR